MNEDKNLEPQAPIENTPSDPMDFEIPILDLEEYEVPEDSVDEIESEHGGAIDYAFIGSGQAGGRLAEQFYALGYKKTICLNTAQNDLQPLNIPEAQKFILDVGQGGAGKNMDRGENATIKYQQEIYDLMRKVFGQKTEHIFVCFGAGGGSGAGSSFALIEVAKKYLQYLGYDDVDRRVGVVMTLPTEGESGSQKVAANATHVGERISEYADKGFVSPTIIIDNNKIKNMYKSLPVAKFWPTINSTVAGLFNIFNLLVNQNSQYSSLDPTDYSTILTAGGHMIMGVTTVKNIQNETDISRAVKSNLEKTLLAEGFDLQTAKTAGCIVVGGKEMFANVAGLMDNIEYGFDTLAQLTGNATIHRGIYEDNRESLRVYTIIGGLDAPKQRYLDLKSKAVVKKGAKNSLYK
tara:strand:+ start:116 stop:1336 length:1221 start_codon:yes stop_codon:yes gene_type:complete